MTTEEKFAKFFDEFWPARATKPEPARRCMTATELLASGGEVCPVVATDNPMRYNAVWGDIWHVETARRQGR